MKNFAKFAGLSGALCLFVVFFTGASALAQAPATPFTISPSIESGLNKEGQDNYFSVDPSLGLGTKLTTGGGYNVNLSGTWSLNYREHMFEDPLASTTSMRDFNNTFGLKMGVAATDAMTVSLGASFVMYRNNAYENVGQDTDTYSSNISVAYSVQENLSVTVGTAFTALNLLHAYPGGGSGRERGGSGEDALNYLGDYSVISDSVFLGDTYGGLLGGSSSVFAQAAQVAPVQSSIVDYNSDGKFGATYTTADQIALTGGYTINKRVSDDQNRDKWSNTVTFSGAKGFWEGGSCTAGYKIVNHNFDIAPGDGVYYRRDINHQLSLGASHNLNSVLTLNGNYAYFMGTSNNPRSDLNANSHIIAATLSAGF